MFDWQEGSPANPNLQAIFTLAYQADVSIAMGHGSDIAMDVAKITLMTSDLAALPKALRLSAITVRGIRQNLFWAFIYNLYRDTSCSGFAVPLQWLFA